MKLLQVVSAVVLIVTASEPAIACRGAFAHQYVLIETPPSQIPVDSVLLTVVTSRTPHWNPATFTSSSVARVTKAEQSWLRGKDVTIRQVGLSSCGRWSESDNANQVVGFLFEETGDLVLVPIPYRSIEYRKPGENRSEGITREDRLRQN